MIANNITRKDFETLLKSGVPVFDGYIIPDNKTFARSFYRFARLPLAEGEHKVDALFGQEVYTYGKTTIPLTCERDMHFLGLIVDNEKTYNESWELNSLFGAPTGKYGHSATKEMVQNLYNELEATVELTEEDYANDWYNKQARTNAFFRFVKQNESYNSPNDTISKGIRDIQSATGIDEDELIVDFLASPTNWAKRTLVKFNVAKCSNKEWGKELVVVENLTKKYLEAYKNPDSTEGKFATMLNSVRDCKLVNLTVDIDGSVIKFKYPASAMEREETIYGGYLNTWDISPRAEQKRVEEFIEKNISKNQNYRGVPMKHISEFSYGKKILWKNPDFVGTESQ